VSDARDVLVWRPSFSRWERARDVPEISIGIARQAPPPLSAPPRPSPAFVPCKSMATQAPANPDSPKNRTNWIARNWRGDFPLWMSYWVFGLLGNLFAFAFAVIVRIAFTPSSGYNPFGLLAALVITWIGIGLIIIWQ